MDYALFNRWLISGGMPANRVSCDVYACMRTRVCVYIMRVKTCVLIYSLIYARRMFMYACVVSM